MKIAIVVLGVLACTSALICNEGTGVTDVSTLKDKSCAGGVEICFSRKDVDGNTFSDYGCGDCPKGKEAECQTCGAKNCNAFTAMTYAQQCNTDNAGKTEDCTGLSTAGCFTVKDGYTGDLAFLKGKYGGCGTCEDTKTQATTLKEADKAFCISCNGVNCNKYVKPDDDKKDDDKKDDDKKDDDKKDDDKKEDDKKSSSSRTCLVDFAIFLGVWYLM